MRESVQAHMGRSLAMTKDVQRCESTEMLWEAETWPEVLRKQWVGLVQEDWVGFAGRMRWKDRVQGGEVQSWI